MAWAVGRSPANQIVSVPLAHALATKKIMFWALARVSFRAAKIVSCNKNIFFHGLRWKLLQLFNFRPAGLGGDRHRTDKLLYKLGFVGI
jgi:hypothetical protein